MASFTSALFLFRALFYVRPTFASSGALFLSLSPLLHFNDIIVLFSVLLLLARLSLLFATRRFDVNVS